MTLNETPGGELRLQIAGTLFDLLADHLGTDDRPAVVMFLEQLPIKVAARLERIAVEDPAFARNYLLSVAGNGGRQLCAAGAPGRIDGKFVAIEQHL